MKPSTRWLAFTALAALGACADSNAAAANAAGSNEVTQSNASATASRDGLTFNAAANGSLLNLAGKVVSTTPTSFQLDVGDDMVTVEMDDWDWFKEGRQLKAGDDVVVTGRVDQDLWERKKMEANSVFVRNLGVTFYANGADEEDLAAALIGTRPVTSTLGAVTSVEGAEFTVGSPRGPVRVDLSQLRVRPVLKVGDTVQAWGPIDIDTNEKLELMAQGVVVLSRDKSKQL